MDELKLKRKMKKRENDRNRLREKRKNNEFKEKELKRRRDWYADNSVKFSLKNNEKLSKYHKEYNKNNKANKKKYDEEYRKKNKGKLRITKMCSGGNKKRDIEMGRYDAENYITKEWVITQINLQNNCCHYCLEQMNLDGEKNNKKLCTIERKNNLLGHVKSNCVMACLNCNVISAKIGHDNYIKHLSISTTDPNKKTCIECKNTFLRSEFVNGKSSRLSCRNCYNKLRRDKRKNERELLKKIKNNII